MPIPMIYHALAFGISRYRRKDTEE